jgi:hypothetical protein
MTHVYIHPEVDDYFVDRDFLEAANGLGSRIVEDYHDGKVILLRNLKLSADLDFLRNVAFCQKWKWKKLAVSAFEGIPLESHKEHSEIAEFVKDVFAGDWGRFRYFFEQAKLVNNQIGSALDVIFTGYRFSRREIIWRFAETRVENLHFDIDKDCDNLELIRLYVNLDDVPRIWYTAGTFASIANEWYRKLDLGRFRNEPHDKLLKEITMKVFGDWHARGRDKVPRHLVMFEPGDVWLSDGRLVSHQVVYGRRVVSSLFVAPSDAVRDPTRTFAQRVAELHRGAEELKDSSTNATVGPAPQIASVRRKKIDLRTAWQDLPEHVLKDTLIRL